MISEEENDGITASHFWYLIGRIPRREEQRALAEKVRQKLPRIPDRSLVLVVYHICISLEFLFRDLADNMSINYSE